jgi:2-methylisocitrate lyase-like PEP mutase family enzyme
MSAADRRTRFRTLHESGLFVMPNPWDAGSAKLLHHYGFEALATTSFGFALTLGLLDMRVSRDQLVAHVELLASATPLPLNVDSERLFPAESGGVGQTVHMLAAAGAAGCSIEDYDPENDSIEDLAVAVERVGVAADAAHEHDVMLTARAENLLRGVDDLDDTIARLRAYRDAGADVVYAPGLREVEHIVRVVDAVGIPVNVLALPGGPSVPELAAAGVRRVSTGGLTTLAAYGVLKPAAEELLGAGTSTYAAGSVPRDDLRRALGS